MDSPYEKCFNCSQFRIVESLRYTRDGEPDGMDPEPDCNIYPHCLEDELMLHTKRWMEDTPGFFMWINGDFAETVLDFHILQEMDKVMELYGKNDS